MTKQQVIEALCCICTSIANDLNDHSLPHDCFCGSSGCDPSTFQFSDWYVDFIKEAVQEKINKTNNEIRIPS